MKVKHLLLSIALVALVAACAKKETPVETPTETAIETPAVEIEEPAVEEPVAAPAPAKTTKTSKPAPKAEEPKVDPCEKIVTDYEAFATRIQNAQKRKGANPDALKEWMALRKEAAAKTEQVKTCVSNPTYKTRVQQSMITVTSSANN